MDKYESSRGMSTTGTLALVIATAIVVVGGVLYFTREQGSEQPLGNIPGETEQQLEDQFVTEENGSEQEDSGGQPSDQKDTREITVLARNFRFSTDVIRVRKGEPVTIKLMSEGGMHDWVVDEFNARTEQIQNGGTSSVTFTPDKAGTFEFYCSVGSHRQAGMVGTLIVEE